MLYEFPDVIGKTQVRLEINCSVLNKLTQFI